MWSSVAICARTCASPIRLSRGPPGAPVRPGPMGRDRQRQPQRHVRQQPPGSRHRHRRRAERQHRQSRRAAADLRGGPPHGLGGRPPTASVTRRGAPQGSWPTHAAADGRRRVRSRSRTRRPPTQPVYPSGLQPRYPSGRHEPPAPARRRSAADLCAGHRTGHLDRRDGRAALERGQPRDQHAEDPPARAGPPRRRRARSRSGVPPTTTL